MRLFLPRQFQLLALFWGKKRENKSQEVLGSKAHCCKLHVVWVSFFYPLFLNYFFFWFLLPSAYHSWRVKQTGGKEIKWDFFSEN